MPSAQVFVSLPAIVYWAAILLLPLTSIHAPRFQGLRSNMAAQYTMAGKFPNLVRLSCWFPVYVMMKLMKWLIAEREFQLYLRITCGIEPEHRTVNRSKKNSSEPAFTVLLFFSCLIYLSFFFQWKIWGPARSPEGGPVSFRLHASDIMSAVFLD